MLFRSIKGDVHAQIYRDMASVIIRGVFMHVDSKEKSPKTSNRSPQPNIWSKYTVKRMNKIGREKGNGRGMKRHRNIEGGRWRRRRRNLIRQVSLEEFDLSPNYGSSALDVGEAGPLGQ